MKQTSAAKKKEHGSQHRLLVFIFGVALALEYGGQGYAKEPPWLYTVLKDGKWGYIDQAGKIAIAPQFTQAGEFSEGLATVSLDGKWGYVDQSGAIVIPPRFAFAEGFSDGLGIVHLSLSEGGSAGYIDKKASLSLSRNSKKR